MEPMFFMIYIVIFLFGITIGSFLNVCIYRIPKGETIVTTPSHCMKCGHRLGVFELVPVFSYIFLRGRCKSCKEPISPQYPMIEVINGLLYVLVFVVKGLSIETVIYCLFTSALVVLSVIDWRTYEIPIGINIFILMLGILHVFLDYKNMLTYFVGFFAVSLFLFLLYVVTKGNAIGGGDIKLMAVAGLLLGYKLIIVAFFAGCILGSVIHLIRMRVTKVSHVLALGPYLSVGLFLSMLWGDKFLDWYFRLSGL